MKLAPSVYRVRVETEDGVDGLVVDAYNLDPERRFVGLEFISISTTADRKGFSIPCGRPATFQEELLVLGRASDALELPRNAVPDRIKALLREAYGSSARVTVEEISV